MTLVRFVWHLGSPLPHFKQLSSFLAQALMLDFEYMLHGWLTLFCSTWLGTIGMYRWFWLLNHMHAWCLILNVCYVFICVWLTFYAVHGWRPQVRTHCFGWLNSYACQIPIRIVWFMTSILPTVSFDLWPICSHIPNSLVKIEFRT